MIDYLAQFKSVSDAVIAEEQAKYKNERTYDVSEAKKAFLSAQRSEALGHDVAFAMNEAHDTLYVWAVAKPEEPKAALVVWHADFQTSSFHFVAIGHTEDGAKTAMLAALAAHGRQYNLGAMWFKDGFATIAEFLDSEVNVNAVRVGGALRDGSVI